MSHNSGIANTYEQSFFGDFVDLFPHMPYSHYDGNLLFWSVQLRDIVQYATVFVWYYLTAVVGVWIQVYLQLPLVFWNSLESRLEFLLVILKLYQKLTAPVGGVSLFWPVNYSAVTTAVRVVETVVTGYGRCTNLLLACASVPTANDRSIENTGPVFYSIFKLMNAALVLEVPPLPVGVGDFCFLALVLLFVVIILLL